MSIEKTDLPPEVAEEARKAFLAIAALGGAMSAFDVVHAGVKFRINDPAPGSHFHLDFRFKVSKTPDESLFISVEHIGTAGDPNLN